MQGTKELVVKIVGGIARVGCIVSATLIGALAIGGCGNGADGRESSASAGGAGPSTSSTAPTSKSPKAAKGATATTTPSAPKAKGSSVATTTTVADTTEPTRDLHAVMAKTVAMEAELTEACVRPGGQQTVKVRTVPGAAVGYDTVYSDGKSGMSEGHYGGNNGLSADGEGTFTDTFVVAPTAPSGRVIVNVLVADYVEGRNQKTLLFAVADALGRCS